MVERIQQSGLTDRKAYLSSGQRPNLSRNWYRARSVLAVFASIINHFAPINRELLEKRETLQAQIDSWHHQHRDDFNFA